MFTGAGISVESGVPPFRGPDGLWEKYDPRILDIQYFNKKPEKAWAVIKSIFYEHIRSAEPNAAHLVCAKLETRGYVQRVITQNIDNLHQKAGSLEVVEYHGNSQRLLCRSCGKQYADITSLIHHLPPLCPTCNGVLKPDFVFFGEPIPIKAHQKAVQETIDADVWVIIGTTGEVFPAASLPFEAKANGKTIIEVNIQPSNYTNNITDVYLQGSAVDIMTQLWGKINDR